MLVESANRGGFNVTAFDQFGDSDTRMGAAYSRLLDDLSTDVVISAIESLSIEQKPFVIYASGIDNNPDLLQQLHQRCLLLGNSAQTIRQVRDPTLFFSLLDDLNIAYPSISYDSPVGNNWLLKRTDLEGGLGVSRASFGSEDDLDAGCYFQQELDGMPFSVLFLADGKSSRIVGFNTQWVVTDNSWQPYLFQGMASHYHLSDQNQLLLETWVASIVVATGLQGLNSVDCLDVDGELVVLEVNPRPGASLTLHDLDYAHGLLAEHINCFTGDVWSDALHQNQVRGSWVVYAPADLRIGENLILPLWVSDRPAVNSVFNCGEPLCTLQASADTIAQVKHMLMQRCAMITNSLLDSSRKVESSMS